MHCRAAFEEYFDDFPGRHTRGNNRMAFPNALRVFTAMLGLQCVGYPRVTRPEVKAPDYSRAGFFFNPLRVLIHRQVYKHPRA